MNADQKACVRAAKRIEKFGWVQGELGNANIGYCIVGAFKAPDDEDSYPKILDSVIFPVAVWNDTEGRTKEEVIDVLIAAAYGDWT